MILILSSHVAAGAVGGGLQAALFARMGIEAVLIPTVLFGRHPGLGAPGGGPTPLGIFAGMIEGVAASDAFGRTRAVIAGYFAAAEQARLAAAAIDSVRAANPSALIVVDPIMGDDPGGLYVDDAVARAVASELVPRADLITPNLWELRRLSDAPGFDPLTAARAGGRPTLLSSVDLGDEIAVVYADSHEAWLAAHARLPGTPHGTGDRLTALFTAGRVRGHSPRHALERAVGGVARSLSVAGSVRLERLA